MGQHILQASFNRGEITPLAHARRDLKLYTSAAALLRNWCVLKYGGIRRRSGTLFVGEAKHHDKHARFMEYVFNTGQSFVLEWGDEYVRFWTQGGQITSGGLPYEVTTPYTEDEVEDIQFAVSNDVIYLAHPNHAPRKLQRMSNTDWTISEVEFKDGPYMPINDTAVTCTPSGGTLTTGASRTFTWSASQGFTSADVGRLFRIAVSNVWAWCEITAVTSTTVVTATVMEGSGQAASASASWQLGCFSGRVGYPACVTFYQQRLVWARTTDMPRAVFVSVSSFPERYTVSKLADGTVEDDHGFTRNITSGQADPILWLKEGDKRIVVGTASAIRWVGPTEDSGEVMTARNVDTNIARRVGSRGVVPVEVDEGFVLVGKNGLSIRNYSEDEYGRAQAPEISVLAEHLCKSKVKRLAYQQTPDSIVWAMNDDGSFFGSTIDRDENVVGYHSHSVSGEVQSVAVIPTDERDELWMLVKRTINGNVKRYVEILQAQFDEDTMAQEDAFFVDCGLTYEGPAINVINGLTHLAGKEVDIFSEGSPLPRATVTTGGQLTLPNGRLTTYAHIGLPIPNGGDTLPPPTLAPDGSTLGRKCKATSVVADVISTLGLEIGPKGGIATQVKFRSPKNPMGTAPPLYSGDFTHTLDAGWGTNGQVSFSCPQPTPATILAMNLHVVAEP
jgi:hypothetical protein